MRIRGFTIMDTMVGMILILLISSFGILGLSNLNQSISRWKEQHLVKEKRNEIRHLIFMEVERAIEIRKNDEAISFIRHNETIRYFNVDNKVLRKTNEKVDTIFSLKSLVGVPLNADPNFLEEIQIEMQDGWAFNYAKEYGSVPLKRKNGL